MPDDNKHWEDEFGAEFFYDDGLIPEWELDDPEMPDFQEESEPQDFSPLEKGGDLVSEMPLELPSFPDPVVEEAEELDFPQPLEAATDEQQIFQQKEFVKEQDVEFQIQELSTDSSEGPLADRATSGEGLGLVLPEEIAPQDTFPESSSEEILFEPQELAEERYDLKWNAPELPEQEETETGMAPAEEYLEEVDLEPQELTEDSAELSWNAPEFPEASEDEPQGMETLEPVEEEYLDKVDFEPFDEEPLPSQDAATIDEGSVQAYSDQQDQVLDSAYASNFEDSADEVMESLTELQEVLISKFEDMGGKIQEISSSLRGLEDARFVQRYSGTSE